MNRRGITPLYHFSSTLHEAAPPTPDPAPLFVVSAIAVVFVLVAARVIAYANAVASVRAIVPALASVRATANAIALKR